MSDNDAGADLAVLEDVDRTAELLSGLREMEAVEPGEISAAQIRRILLAETEEEAFEETPTLNSEEIEGRPFEVSDAMLLPSKYNGGKGAFVAANVTLLDTGEQAVYVTSAARPAARICWLKMHDRLPRQCLVTVVSEATAAGHRLYGLELVG